MSAQQYVSLFLTAATLVFSFGIEAESESSKNRKSKLNIEKCVKLVKRSCGERDYKTCMANKDEKTAKVSACLAYLVTENGKKKINTEGLGKSIKELITNSEMSLDQKKCFEVSKLVCGEEEDMDSCMKKKAGKFPSFCRQAAIQGVDSLKEVYRNDRKAAMCADILVAKCDLVLPEAEEKPNPKQYQAALSKYQSCVKKRVTMERDCKGAIDIKKEGTATQLIR